MKKTKAMINPLPRRKFLQKAAITGGALPFLSFSAVTSKTNTDNKVIEKAKNAMLAMQRKSWEQGVAAQALLEMGEDDLVVLFARNAIVNQLQDGRLALIEGQNPVADPAANGEPVLYAARLTSDNSMKQAADRMLNFLLNKAHKTSEGYIYHNMNENRIWVDALYMMPPFLAAAGKYDEAVKQLTGYRQILFDPQKNMFHHIWDEDKKEFARSVFWGGGNGWAASGMARVIKALPDTYQKEKKMIAGWIRELLDGCLKYQREDSLFHDIVDDPSSFVETNMAQMLAYTIYRGVKAGWLESSYLKYADKMRSAANKKVDKYGIVQGVAGAPHFNKPGTSTEGQAFFLLMETAYRDLKK